MAGAILNPRGLTALHSLLSIDGLQAHSTVADMLTIFADGISKVEAEQDAEFRGFLMLATSALGVSHTDLAARLMVTRVTLQRWLSGDSLPSRLARRGILAELSEMAFEVIDQVNTSAERLSTPDILLGNASRNRNRRSSVAKDCDGNVSDAPDCVEAAPLGCVTEGV